MKFMGIVVGVVELVVGALLMPATGGASFVIAQLGFATLITASGTLLLSTISNAITGSPKSGVGAAGFSTASRNPISPWNVIYGRSVVGGTIVYLHEWGDNNKYFDIIIVLACHACQSVDRLLFNQQPVQLSTDQGAFNGIRGDSFGPLQQNVSIGHIARSNGVVSVQLKQDIPLLQIGDRVLIEGITGDRTLNGTVYVQSVVHTFVVNAPGSVTFTYISGGGNSAVDNEGKATTTWPDYGSKIHMEVLLGNHTATFPGLLTGTPDDDNLGTSVHYTSGRDNPWTANHKLLGKTCVFLRLHYSDKYFANGLPQISFAMKGKNDILDPRTSPATIGYTENAALCTADYLAEPDWGFKALYGTEIPLAPLIAAANICDEVIPLAAGGTELRYGLNGRFDLTVHRGEILQNLLTACAGRLTYEGGQFGIHPAAWTGSSPAPDPGNSAMVGPYRWRPTTTVRDLFNGVKGTYISPANNWQASDIPPYAQDILHGYPSDANVTADGGERRWMDIQLPFTISPSAAQRICKIELMRKRMPGSGTFIYNLSGYAMQTLDVISMTLPYFSWTNKLLEVVAHRFTMNEQRRNNVTATVLGTEIDVIETDASVYVWSPTEELTAEGFRQPTLPNAFTPAPPTGFALLSDYSTVLGTFRGFQDSILAQWIVPVDGYVTNGGHIELRYQLASVPVTAGTAAIDITGNLTLSNTVLASQMIGAVLAVGTQTFTVSSIVSTTTGIVSPSPATAIAASPFSLTPQGVTWIGLPSVNPSVTQVNIMPVVNGLQYIAQIRSVNTASVPSEWVSAGPVTAAGAGGPDDWKANGDDGATTPLDAIYGNRSTFCVAVEYANDKAGHALVLIDIAGYPPTNALSKIVTAPIVPMNATVLSTGGTIPAGSYEIVLAAKDNNPTVKLSARSSTIRAVVASGTTNSIVISPIVYSANTIGYQAYIGVDRNALTFAPSATPAGLPTSITITSLPVQTFGPPDIEFDHFHVQSAEVVAGWLWILQVTDINAAGTVLTFAGENMVSNEFINCVLSLVGQGVTGPLLDQPIMNQPITANTLDAVAVGTSITGIVHIGDFMMCRVKPTVASSTQFGDSKIINSVATQQGYPLGLPVNGYAGNYLFVIGGAGAGQFATIASNDATTYTFTNPLDVALDSTSICDILAQTFFYDNVTPSVTFDGRIEVGGPPQVAQVACPNYAGKMLFTRVLTETVDGLVSDPLYAPFRGLYISGQSGSLIPGESLAPLVTIISAEVE